jgi:hypothetical protein
MKMTHEPPDPSVILADVDWSILENANGPAFPETPTKLAALVSGDPNAVKSALDHLGNALLNDGVVYSATAPAVWYVAALLGDPRSGKSLALYALGREEGKYPLRGKLLTWLANVAYDVSEEAERRIRIWAGYSPTEPFPCFLEIRQLYPRIFPIVDACLHDSDPRLRETALVVAVQLLESPELVSRREALVPAVRNMLAVSSDKWHRRVAIEALEAWGEDVGSLRAPLESATIDEESWTHDLQEERGSIDEPP